MVKPSPPPSPIAWPGPIDAAEVELSVWRAVYHVYLWSVKRARKKPDR